MRTLLREWKFISAWLLIVIAQLRCALSVTKEYVFNASYFLIDPDKSGAAWMQGVNNMLPGPTIRVHQGDRLRVILVNNCQVEELAIHWHGFEMRHAQEYDGAKGVTMCGLHPGHTLTYDFIVDETPGSYAWHEHAELEHVAGRALFGALIVEEPSNGLWINEYCSGCDVVLNLFDHWRVSQHELERMKMGRLVRPPAVSKMGNGVGLLPFHNLLINGKGAFNVFSPNNHRNGTHVTADSSISDLFEIAPASGETWRLRLINDGAMFAIRFRIDLHRMRIIQSDGGDTVPFDCDAITMSAGERFDVLVTFNQNPGTYWMRAETLETAFGTHHGQLGVIRYQNTASGVVANKGYSISNVIFDNPGLVTVNCIDQAELSNTCLPITALRRHKSSSFSPTHIGTMHDSTHDFEVSLRGFAGDVNTHMVRLIDLQAAGNHYGENQFEGPYTQFHVPGVPPPYDEWNTHHENTVVMNVAYNETVRVVLQMQDRAAHPWHLHGHKFAVLAQGFPDYDKDCDIMYCRSKENHWITRDGAVQANGKLTSFGRRISDDDKVYSLRYPQLLDPQDAPLKDTVHLPAGGWAVIQFKADNPGWWFFHCHMIVHAMDGMALVLVEGADQIPARLSNKTYLDDVAHLPSCDGAIAKYQKHGRGSSCSCWANPEMKWDNIPRTEYRCSSHYLCGDQILNPLEPQTPQRKEGTDRDRGAGTSWRLMMVLFWLLIVGFLFAYKWHRRRGLQAKTNKIVGNLVDQGFHVMEGVYGLGVAAADVVGAHVDDDEFLRGSADDKMRQLACERAIKGMLDEYALDIEFVARRGHRSEPAVRGVLEPGSVMVVLGAHDVTTEWIYFFGARKQRHVRGNLFFEGIHLSDWSRKDIRQMIGWLPRHQGAMRSDLQVVEVLELYMRLGCNRNVHKEWADVLRHREKLIGMLNLGHYLTVTTSELRYEVLLRVMIATQLFLPRSVLVLQDPFDGLNFKLSKRMMKMLVAVAQTFRVTIILSADHVFEEIGNHMTHALVVSHSMPLFGNCQEIRNFCSFAARHNPTIPAPPPNKHILEHCSSLISKNIFDSIICTRQRDAGNFTTADSVATGKSAELNKGSTKSVELNKGPTQSVELNRDATKSMDAKRRSGRNVTFSVGDCFIPVMDCDVWQTRSGTTSKRSAGTPNSAPTMNDVPTKNSYKSRTGRPKLEKLNSVIKEVFGPTAVMPVRNKVHSGSNGSGTRTHPPRIHRPLIVQFGVLLEFELLRGLKEYITPYKFIETAGLGCVAGMVWWRKGSDLTQTALGELVGLLFFSTALWSVPPVFQALASAPMVLELATREFSGGLYHLNALVMAMFVASVFLLTAIWPPLWQIIAYTFAEVGADVGTMIQMHIILNLNVLTMRTMGLVLALVVPDGQTNVVVGNLVAQLFMLTNGFYTKLPKSFMWVTVVSVPRYTLKALLKLEFSWDDSFLVAPMTGNTDFAIPTMYTPAQMTGTFQTMYDREMDVMKSFTKLSAVPEMLYLIAFTLGFQLLFMIVLAARVLKQECDRTPLGDDAFIILDTRAWLLEIPDEELPSTEAPSENVEARQPPHCPKPCLMSDPLSSKVTTLAVEANPSTTVDIEGLDFIDADQNAIVDLPRDQATTPPLPEASGLVGFQGASRGRTQV